MSAGKDVAVAGATSSVDRGDEITAGERAYFAAVGLLAGVVGFPAYFAPAKVTKVLPFDVPPLHARFIGAVYLSGFAFMVCGLLARRWSAIRWVPLMTAIWTGGLLLITLLHHDDFDFTKTQTRVWFGAYVAYPLIGIWILFNHRGDPTMDERGPVPAAWARQCLVAQGIVLTTAGLALLLAPGPMADAWPWPVTSLLAQIYSAPVLAYGVGSLLLARVRTWRDMRVGVLAIALFAVGALVASLIHLELFAADDLAAWIWFGALGAIIAVAALLAGSSRTSA
ncbi:MAG: hypothetical protein QOG87_3091 [Actinomycetota bacterium]|jgi:hypothetical protein